MFRYAFFFALVLGLGALLGCGKAAGTEDATDVPEVTQPEGGEKKPDTPVASSGSHVGSWTLVHSDELKKQFADQKASGLLPKDAALPEMTFTLSPDGVATMGAKFMGDEFAAKGTYTVDGEKITIKQSEVLKNGKPDPEAELEDVVIVWSADKTMLESEGADEMKMQFKRA